VITTVVKTEFIKEFTSRCFNGSGSTLYKRFTNGRINFGVPTPTSSEEPLSCSLLVARLEKNGGNFSDQPR
jgi:hypothetical protein